MPSLHSSVLLIASQLIVPTPLSSNGWAEVRANIENNSFSDSNTVSNEIVSFDSSTQEGTPLHNPFYNSIANEMLSFLRDEDDLDFQAFEQQLKDFLQYNELPLFCSYLLQSRTDEDIAYFIKGVIETDVDIYSNFWFRQMLESILHDSSRRAGLRHVSQVIFDEYFRF